MKYADIMDKSKFYEKNVVYYFYMWNRNEFNTQT